MPKMYPKIALTVLLGLTAISNTQAATYSTTINNLSRPPGVQDNQFTLFVPNFDTSLGTLTGFNFQFTGLLSETVYLPGPFYGQQLAGVFTNSVSVLDGTNAGPIQLPGAQGVVLDTNHIAEMVQVDFSTGLPSSYLTMILPGQQVDLNFGFDSQLTLIPAGGLGASDDFFGFIGPIRIIETFTYTPTTVVPEPASVGLLVAGLFGLGAARRRRLPNSRSSRSAIQFPNPQLS